MKSKSSMITVGQFAQVEEDSRPGFKTRWIVDKHGCPACGNITKYELKLPTMPIVSTCSHCTGYDHRPVAGKDIWIFNYHYDQRAAGKKVENTENKKPGGKPEWRKYFAGSDREGRFVSPHARKHVPYHDTGSRQLDLSGFFLLNPPSSGKEAGKPHSDPDEGPGIIRRPGFARGKPNGETSWAALCPICGELNEIHAFYGDGGGGKWGWITDQRGPPAKQCRHYDARELMRINPYFYFRKPESELTLIELASGKVITK